MIQNLILTILITGGIGISNVIRETQQNFKITLENQSTNFLGSDVNNNYYQRTAITYIGENTNTTGVIQGYRYCITNSSQYNKIDTTKSIILTILKINVDVDVELQNIETYYSNKTVSNLDGYTLNETLVYSNNDAELDEYFNMPYFSLTTLNNIYQQAVNHEVDHGASANETYTGTNLGNNNTINHDTLEGYYTSNIGYIVLRDTITYPTTLDTVYLSQQNFYIQIQNYGLAALTKMTINYIEPSTVINPTIEVIDLGGLFFQILAMPFAFISQAFNLVLFPGTPYVIHVGGLILGITGLLVMMLLVSLIMKSIK